MSSDQEAQAAISALNGKEVDGRTITVNEANLEKTEAAGRAVAEVATAEAADATSETVVGVLRPPT